MTDITRGDIVECVDDRPNWRETQVMPHLGVLYVVASIRPVSGGHSVRLKELTPTCHRGGSCACGDCGWDANRFRKVYRPSADLLISLLMQSPEFVD